MNKPITVNITARKTVNMNDKDIVVAQLRSQGFNVTVNEMV